MFRSTAADDRPAVRRPTPRAPFAVLALALLALAAAACAGDSGDAGDAGAAAESPVAGMPTGDAAPAGPRAEWEAIARHITEIQQQAFSAPEIDSARAEVQAYVETRMAEFDATIPDKLVRFRELQERMQDPALAEDTTAARGLVDEAMGIQQALRVAQGQALQDAEVQSRTAAFEAKVLDKMRELDPDTDSLMARADSLSVVIRSRMADSLAQQAPMPPAPAPPTGDAGGTTP